MSGSEILELIAKHLSNESTTEENSLLTSWINSSQANRRQYELLKRTWDESKPVSDPERLSRGKAMVFERIRQEFPEAKNSSRLVHKWLQKTVLARAAAALLIIALSWYSYIKLDIQLQQHPARLVIVESENDFKDVLLHDGSTVRLYSGSQIRYVDNLPGKIREIFLNGEAFFNVKRDESKPFVVHSGSLTTRVLGTSFTIKAREEQSDIEITVSSGKVSLSDSSGVIAELEKDQQLSYQKYNGTFTRQTLKSEINRFKKDDELVLEGETFGDAAQILEDRYNVQIKFADSKIRKISVSARFNEDESLAQILHMLTLATNTEYNDETNIILIHEKNRKSNPTN